MNGASVRIGVTAVAGVALLAGLLSARDSEERPEQLRDRAMPWIERSSAGDELRAGGRRFIAFGFNYGCGVSTNRTLDFFSRRGERCRAQVSSDMKTAKRLGANTLRVYLELFAFIRRKGGEVETRDRSLEQLRWILQEAQRLGIYLDLTGNLVWRGSRAWYDAMGDRERWRVQAKFWRAIAREAAGSPAVLAYELTNEPVVPTSDPGTWYGAEIDGLRVTQYIVRDLRGRDPDQVARSWITRLSRAIRREDSRHLIGVGLLPFLKGPFGPPNVADLLDILFLHEYPPGPVGRPPSITRVREFKGYGRPVIIGETLALTCGPEAFEEFLRSISGYADGYLSFFDGRAPEDVEVTCDYDRVYLQSLASFLDLGPELVRGGCPACRARAEGSAFARRTQRQKGSEIVVRVEVEAKEDLNAVATGRIQVNRSYELKPSAARVPLGQTRTLLLRPESNRAERRIAMALTEGKQARARLTVRLKDGVGNKQTQRLEVKLKR